MKKNIYGKENVLNEIENNRNHSWFEEIKERSKTHEDKIALRYKGLNITYKEFIDTCEKVWAPALKQAGITKGSTVVASIASTPELCYLIGAVSIVGAKINLISDKFDEDYIRDIIKQAGSKYVFIGEDRFNNFASILKNSDNILVPIDLNHSLKNGDPFQNITDQFLKHDKNEYKYNVEHMTNIKKLDTLLEEGKEYNGQVSEQSTLDDEFTITYSSGTTDGNKPKGIVHRNKHYIVMGRYHDSEVSGIPNLKDSITYSLIPTNSNSYIASILSDTLMEGASIALDPVTDMEYFVYGMQINKPYMAIASTSSWLYLAKNYYKLTKEQQKGLNFSKTLLAAAVGEGMSAGEEKFLNKFLSDAKFGVGITKLPHSLVKMSTCGGDCEHGSLFIRVFRSYANLKKDRKVDEPIGLQTYNFVDIKALRKDGTYCDTYEYGRLVANSVCTMKGYNNEPERTKAFFIKDAYGKEWADLCCYGYFDKDNNIYLKGRMSEDTSKIPEFMVNDEITKDTKNVMSCSVVSSVVDGNEVYVAYIEPQVFTKTPLDKIISSVSQRCESKFGKDFIDKLYISIVDHDKSYPLTKCLKRDNGYLRSLGLSCDCKKATDYIIEKNKKNSMKLVKHI